MPTKYFSKERRHICFVGFNTLAQNKIIQKHTKTVTVLYFKDMNVLDQPPTDKIHCNKNMFLQAHLDKKFRDPAMKVKVNNGKLKSSISVKRLHSVSSAVKTKKSINKVKIVMGKCRAVTDTVFPQKDASNDFVLGCSLLGEYGAVIDYEMGIVALDVNRRVFRLTGNNESKSSCSEHEK